MKLTIYAPATSANLAAGFDSLGAALAPESGEPWGDTVEIEPADTSELIVKGSKAPLLPADPKDNLAWIAWNHFADSLQKKGKTIIPARLVLHKNLPISSGLGSSASSIVAALVALNKLHNSPLSQNELLFLAGKTEGHASGSLHFDNVAPCLLGGMQLVMQKSAHELSPCVALPFAENWRLVVVHPHCELSTKQARSVLPTTLALATGVAQAQLLAGLVAALFKNDDQLLRTSAHDLIAEPVRAALIPGYQSVKDAAMAEGSLACNLSGSGPSVFAWVTKQHAQAVRESMGQAFAKHDLQSDGHICKLDLLGARLV
jgi:homoserine kinase